MFLGLTLPSKQHKALSPLRGVTPEKPDGDFQWIDVRRTGSTRLAELGFSEEVIDRVLDHARASVTARHYNQHQYVEEIRAALTAWYTEIARILANKPKRQPKVLQMRGRR